MSNSKTKKPSEFPVSSSISGYVLGVSSANSLEKLSPHAVSAALMTPGGSVITDLNEATTPGVFLLDGAKSPLNAPPGAWYTGILEVFNRYGAMIFQRITARNGEMAVRTLIGGEWQAWKVFKM